MGRLCAEAHEISGIKAPIFLRRWMEGGGVVGGGVGSGGVGGGGVGGGWRVVEGWWLGLIRLSF